MLEKLKGLIKRSKKEEIPEELEEVEEKVEKIKKRVDEGGAWNDFKDVCSDYGVDYREVIAKCAWSYLEETGGVSDDPVSRLKAAAETLKDVEEVISNLSRSESLQKVKETTDAVKQVAELKKALRDVKSGEITAADLIMLAKKAGFIK
jgi:anti-sigma28 factor (negative regulator of flagellin synthesis)